MRFQFVPDQGPSAEGEIERQDEDMLQQPNAHHPVEAAQSAAEGAKSQIEAAIHKVIVADHVQQEHDQNNIKDVVDGAHVLHLQQSGEVRFPGNEHFFGQLSSLLTSGCFALDRWPWMRAICMAICGVADVCWRLTGHAIVPGALPIGSLEVGELVGTQLALSQILQHILYHAGQPLLEVGQHLGLELLKLVAHKAEVGQPGLRLLLASFLLPFSGHVWFSNYVRFC